MSAEPDAAIGVDDRGPRKAALFDYLDNAVGASGLLSELPVKPAAELWNVEPVKMPRHIWLYWHDGWDDAPEVAKLCLRSWQIRNPGCAVHALGHASLGSVLANPPMHRKASKLNGFANRVRLRLLRTHGGVWADATLFCCTPLEAWLPMLMPPARMFAFAAPAPDRIVSTWFLASVAHAPLMRAWERVLAAYFERLESDQRWIHAYFVMAYILEYIATRHPGLAATWQAMPKVPAPESGRIAAIAQLQQEGMPPSHSLTPEQCAAVAQTLKTTALQKLTWKGAIRDATPAAQQVLAILKADLDEAPGAAAAR